MISPTSLLLLSLFTSRSLGSYAPDSANNTDVGESNVSTQSAAVQNTTASTSATSKAACRASSTCFDYIIVGGGTAGLAVAARLSEDTTKTVLVIEAGIDYESNSTIASVVNTPADGAQSVGADTACNSAIDWCFKTTPQTGLNGRSIQYARGKTLGGSSARNLLCYHRPTKQSMDLWALVVGDSSFNWSNMFKYYLKSSVFTPPNSTLRGITDPPTTFNPSSVTPEGSGIGVTYANWVEDINVDIGNGMKAAGLNTEIDFLSGSLDGVAYLTGQLTSNAVRSTSRNSYLTNAEARSNLVVLTSTMAQSITFSGTTATGVTVTNSTGSSQKYTARLEVILSAGTFQSPQLLMVSGIGPKSTLSKYNIKQIVENENVGQGMQDHTMFAISYQVTVGTNSRLSNPDPTFLLEQVTDYAANGTGLFSDFGADQLGFERFSDSVYSSIGSPNLIFYPRDWPTVEYLPAAGYGTNFSGLAEQVQPTPFPDQYASENGIILQPTSRGSITISSASMNDAPVIDPGFITTESDANVLVQIFKRIRDTWATTPLSTITTREAYPGPSVSTDDEILAYIRNNAMTVWHATSTNAMLPQILGGVVDNKFKVYGASNLRVVDASVFPFLPPGHPTSTVYAIAEKAADIIKAAHPSNA